jgi:hypothetical protein
MIFENNMITICFLLLIITGAVICDCGSPALPVDAYIKSEQFTKSLNLRYAENTELTTDCMNTRQVDIRVKDQVIVCQQNSWNALIKRCGKDICIK